MPKEVIEQVRALMREGYSESSAYAIAISNFKRRHGHAPRMHHKLAKEAGVPPPGQATQVNNRNRSFILTPELIMQEQLLVQKRMLELLEEISRKLKNR